MSGSINAKLFGARIGVGIGETAPTALAELAAGTATAGTAPLKLNAGTNLTAPEAGAIEFDGTSLFYTNALNQRQTLNTSGADVVGPASSTDMAVTRFDGTSGKLLKNSGVICDDSNNVSGISTLSSARLGLGNNTSPSAIAQFPAGTATAGTAPIKLTSGTNLTAPEAGAIEFDGTNLFYTNNANARQTLNISGANVVGPGSATANAMVRFDGTTGKLIKNSGVICDDSNNLTGINSANINGATGNTLIVDTNVLVVDATNNRVGIGNATPSATLDIVGTEGQKFRGIAAGYTGSQDFKLQEAVQTTDNTPTTIISLALSEGEMATVWARINGFQSDFSDALSASVLFGVRRGTGGNVTILGNPIIDVITSDGNANVTATVDTGTQTLLIQVTGVTAQTWNWASTYNYQKVLTNS